MALGEKNCQVVDEQIGGALTLKLLEEIYFPPKNHYPKMTPPSHSMAPESHQQSDAPPDKPKLTPSIDEPSPHLNP